MLHKRIKSVDIFRGLGMIYIMVGHMIDWWSRPVDDWLFYVYVSLFSALGAAGFVFISGVSTMISYRKRREKANNQEDYSIETVKKEYLIRGLLILGVALAYNGIVAIEFFDPLNIWKWFIILTVAVCLIFAWPFLRTSSNTLGESCKRMMSATLRAAWLLLCAVVIFACIQLLASMV